MSQLKKRIEKIEAELCSLPDQASAAAHETLARVWSLMKVEAWKAIAEKRWDALVEPARSAWLDHEKACPQPARQGGGCIHRDRFERAASAMVHLSEEQVDEQQT